MLIKKIFKIKNKKGQKKPNKKTAFEGGKGERKIKHRKHFY